MEERDAEGEEEGVEAEEEAVEGDFAEEEGRYFSDFAGVVLEAYLFDQEGYKCC